jgi:hypothetical protein
MIFSKHNTVVQYCIWITFGSSLCTFGTYSFLDAIEIALIVVLCGVPQGRYNICTELLIELSALAHLLSSRNVSSSYFRCASVSLAGNEYSHFVHSFVLSLPGARLTCNHVWLLTPSLIT